MSAKQENIMETHHQIEREGALGGLFQTIIQDMKVQGEGLQNEGTLTLITFDMHHFIGRYFSFFR